MKLKKIFLKQIDKRKQFFGKYYSDYENLPKNSLAHDIVPLKPYLHNLEILACDIKLPLYLQTIIVGNLSDVYNIYFNKRKSKEELNSFGQYNLFLSKIELKYYDLFEVIEFEYHYQFKLNIEININDTFEIIQDFIDSWKNEYISYSDNMIIVNKKYYESN